MQSPKDKAIEKMELRVPKKKTNKKVQLGPYKKENNKNIDSWSLPKRKPLRKWSPEFPMRKQ